MNGSGLRTLVIVLISLFQPGAKTRMTAPSSNSAIDAAKVAILAAKETTPGFAERIPFPSILLVPHGEYSALDQAAVELTRLAKPAWCAGSAAGGSLRVECMSVPNDHVSAVLAEREHTKRFVREWAAENVGPVGELEQIVVITSVDRLAITYGALLAWVDDYDGNWAFALSRDHGAVRSGQARFVVEIAPSQARVIFSTDSAGK